jgi:hypothetical protein
MSVEPSSPLRLTLFTAPKPFQGHIGVIQTNAIRSWQRLGNGVDILLVGREPGLAEAAAGLGVRHEDSVARSPSGAPLLRSALEAARRASPSPFLCYLNADIVLLDDFRPSVEQVLARLERFLIVGSRWDLELRQSLRFEAGWEKQMREELARGGVLHRPVGSDYFVFPSGQYDDLPDFTLGRSGWDNWMIFDAGAGCFRSLMPAGRSRSFTRSTTTLTSPAAGRTIVTRRVCATSSWPAGARPSFAWRTPIGSSPRAGSRANAWPTGTIRANGRRTSSPAWARDAERGSSGWLSIPSRR